jgi:hypothetical protein
MMESSEEPRRIILKELTSDDPEVRAQYLNHFGQQLDRFADAMARAFVNWHSLDIGAAENDKLAHVSALVLIAITLHILSMKLFLSGYAVASGAVFRQVLESVALALVCSGKELGVLEKFMQGKYSTNNAIRDAMKHATRLGLEEDAIAGLRQAQKFYHKFSHPSLHTIAAGVSFSQNALYVGAAFDEAKLESYRKEITNRISLADVFSSFLDVVKVNVAKWELP